MNNLEKMSKGYVSIGEHTFKVSLAIEEKEQMDGLMHFNPPLTSMAFVYAVPQINRFWMNNVKAELDIVFCYKGKVIDIVRGEKESTRLIGNDEFTDLIIELPLQVSSKYDINVGDDVKMSLSKEAVSKILHFEEACF